MMWKKPLPTSPSTASAGTRTSWNASSAVSEACMPSFSSFFSRITPGRSMSTRKSVKPSWPASASVLVTSTMKSARWPLVM